MYLTDDFICLLNKSFTGEITSAEDVALREMIAQSPENQKLAEELTQVWDYSSIAQITFNPDLDHDFAQLQSKLSSLEEKPLARVIPMGQMLMRIAAVMALLIAAVWTWNTFGGSHTPVQTETAANQDFRLLELPDGSHVWLRRDAQLQFPQKFDSKERRVQLNGEAYFEVTHNPAQPFKVELPDHGTVEVLGTQFDVRALAAQDESSVLVRTGKVRFNPESKQGVVLTTGQKAVFSRERAKIFVTEAATFNELAWQAGGLEFVRTPLVKVISDLETYYRVKIELRNRALSTCTYTAPLTNQPIDKVLESIALTYQMRVKKMTTAEYVLEGGNCQ
ncbi:MAG: FecR domain-containing protein [Bacteroidota bacterium]